MLADDVAAAGHDAPFLSLCRLDADRFGLAPDFRAAGARALGQSLRHVGGSGVAVERVIERAFEIVGVLDERPEFLDLRWPDDVGSHAEHAGDVGVVPVLVQAILGAGEPQRAAAVKTDLLARLGLDLRIDLVAAQVEPARSVARRVDRHRPGGVPGRSGSEFAALQQNGVRPAACGQRVKNVGADDAAADHNNSRMRFQWPPPVGT